MFQRICGGASPFLLAAAVSSGVLAQTDDDRTAIASLGKGVLIYSHTGTTHTIRELRLDGTGSTVTRVLFDAGTAVYKDRPLPMLSRDGTNVYFRKCSDPLACDIWRIARTGNDIAKFSSRSWPYLLEPRISTRVNNSIVFTSHDVLINNGLACRGSDAWWQTPLIWLMDSSGGAWKVSGSVAAIPDSSLCRDQIDVAWPLVAFRIYAHASSVYVYDIEKKTQTRIANGGNPSLSPDAKRLIMPVSGGFTIYAENAGKWSRTVTVPDLGIGLGKLKWSNHPDWVLAEARKDSMISAWALNVVTKRLVRLTFDGGGERGGLFLEGTMGVSAPGVTRVPAVRQEIYNQEFDIRGRAIAAGGRMPTRAAGVILTRNAVARTDLTAVVRRLAAYR